MQAVNMNYISPAQTYADENKYSNNKSSLKTNLDGGNSDYDSVNYMNKNSYLPKGKPSMNNSYLRLMMETSNNGNGNNINYDDYHYPESMNLSQPINLSQTSNNIPSPSFSQYQNPPSSTLNPHKYSNGIHHNRSNPYEYTMNSGDYTFEEYLRESKIKRSRSDNNSTEYTMNNHSSSGYYGAPEYSTNKMCNNNNHSHYMNNYNYSNSGYSQNGSSFTTKSNYDEIMKQKYEYDYNKGRSNDMNSLCRNMNNVMQQEPMSKRMMSDQYPMKFTNVYNSSTSYETNEPPSKKQVLHSWNSVYSVRTSSTMTYTNENSSLQNIVHDQNLEDLNKASNLPYSSYPLKSNENPKDVVAAAITTAEEAKPFSAGMTSEPERIQYTQEREDQLFIFYINYLRKELYKNIREMNKISPSLKGSDTNSSISTPTMDGPVILNAKGSGTIFNNNAISNVNAIPSINNGENNTNNSSQSSYMTSQSDPYYSPPSSPKEGENRPTDVKYCIHLVLNNGKIESYIMLPNECDLCHHTCHMETVVETVAEIYSNRVCRNVNVSCKYCTENNCCKRCFEFAKTHVSNDDIAIDLETVESFMNKYTSDSSEENTSSASSNTSDIMTLSGSNASIRTLNSPVKESTSCQNSVQLTKMNSSSTNPNLSGLSDKRSESSATLAMDQSSSFENDTSKLSTNSDSRLTKSNSSKSTDLQHQRSMNETFLKNYNLYSHDNKSTHALKTPGESITDAKAKVDISKSDSRHDPTSHDMSLEMDSKPGNTSTTSTSSYQEAVANTSTTAKNMAKVIENTSFESRKGYDKYEKHMDYKDDPKTIQRLHRAEESRRRIKERIGYERKILSYLEAHNGEINTPEETEELIEIFIKEFSFYGFILRFSMVFAIICSMFSEHSRHISYTVDSFISISKIVVFVIVKNITPITSCISALILYVRFIETMDYETAGERYKIVRHFSELVRDEEFGHCVDKILGDNLERVPSMDEDHQEKMDIDDPKTADELASIQFKSKRRINSNRPIFPSSSMNERNRNVVIDSYLLFIICLIISHKYTIDTCEYNYKNKSWYFIYTFFLKDYKNPNMTMKQFNQYEFYILCVLQYDIHISMEEYNNFDVFVKRNCSSFGKDLSLYITTNVLEKLSRAMVYHEYYKKLNSNNYKNYIFNSVINNMESKIRVFFEQVIAMVKRNTSEYHKKYYETTDTGPSNQ